MPTTHDLVIDVVTLGAWCGAAPVPETTQAANYEYGQKHFRKQDQAEKRNIKPDSILLLKTGVATFAGEAWKQL